MLQIAGGILLALGLLVAGALVFLNWRLAVGAVAVVFVLTALLAPLVR